MYYTDPLTVERLTALRVQTARRQAQSSTLLHQVASKEKSLPHHGHRLLRRMGHQLVVLGRWLEQYSAPQHSYQ